MEISNNINYSTDNIYNVYSDIQYQSPKVQNHQRNQTERKEYLPELTDQDIEKIIENYKNKYQSAQKKRKRRKGLFNLCGHALGTIVPIGTVLDKSLDWMGVNVAGLGNVNNKAKNEEELRRNLKSLQASIKNINDSLNNPYMSESEKQRLLTVLENFVEIEERGGDKETPNKGKGLDNYREQVQKLKSGDIDAFNFDASNCIRLAASIERNTKKVENETNLKLMTETDQYAYAYWTGNSSEIDRLKEKED
ncbi:MAG: hypothetical protein ACP5QK_00230 [Myxococcota bacterium]